MASAWLSSDKLAHCCAAAAADIESADATMLTGETVEVRCWSEGMSREWLGGCPGAPPMAVAESW
jgi:hypothetical protein